MLLKQVDLLESQNQQFKVLIDNYEVQDSLNNGIIEANKEFYNTIIIGLNEDLKKEIRKRKLAQIGFGSTIVVAIVTLLTVK